MNYDFDTIVDRRNTGSLKWDVGAHELPMWAADMDFPTAPAVRAVLEQRMAHGVFGCSVVPVSTTGKTCWKARWPMRTGNTPLTLNGRKGILPIPRPA